MTTLGDVLVSFLTTARRDVLISAPFVRTAALERLLKCIRDDVDVVVVTRWRPEDVLAGASDLNVFDLAKARGIPLLLRYDLHAKLFAADDLCLVGSANVTQTALGWREPANLELLTTASRRSPDIATFERALLAGAVEATQQHQNRLRSLVDRLLDRKGSSIAGIADEAEAFSLLPAAWMPRTMNPDELYEVYVHGDDAGVSQIALPAMRDELRQLGIAPGMSDSDFRAWVAAAISQTPIVDAVMKQIDIAGAITEEVFSEMLERIGADCEDYSAREGLLTLERWLTYFLPGEYQTRADSIKLIKTKLV